MKREGRRWIAGVAAKLRFCKVLPWAFAARQSYSMSTHVLRPLPGVPPVPDHPPTGSPSSPFLATPSPCPQSTQV